MSEQRLTGNDTSTAHEDGAEGVSFPVDARGHRGSLEAGRAIVAEAMAAISATDAARVASDSRWHRSYCAHLRRLVETGLVRAEDALAIARAGLASVHATMRFVRDGDEVALAEATALKARFTVDSATMVCGAVFPPAALVVPYRGEQLEGESLLAQLDRWVGAGIVEPSHASAVARVVEHPEWLDLSDRSFVLLGASAEIAPLQWLSQWRARIVAIDLPDAHAWERLVALASAGNATVIAPRRRDKGKRKPRQTSPAAQNVAFAAAASAGSLGANLLTDLPELARWIAALPGPLTIGAYAYLDGARNVQVCAAMDALTAAVLAKRDDASLAFLATPTDVYATPLEAAAQARARYAGRGIGQRAWQAPLSIASGGRFFRPNYPKENLGANAARLAVCDSLVAQQGANYALAKRLQQWRALASRAAGVRTSINVAPSTTTRSVTRRRELAAAFAGADRFGVEAFEPATTRALMAAMLVHDLRCDDSAANPATPLDHPYRLLIEGANHGGMWRMPFSCASALPFAAAFGWSSTRPVSPSSD